MNAGAPSRPLVLVSFETDDRLFCVDVFRRPDGSFGFEEFRSDADGAGRWQSLGRHSQLSFASGAEALRAAQARVPWLSRDEVWRW